MNIENMPTTFATEEQKRQYFRDEFFKVNTALTLTQIRLENSYEANQDLIDKNKILERKVADLESQLSVLSRLAKNLR